MKTIHNLFLGLCMFLKKRFSIVDDYSCRNFVEGCPNSTYRINNIHICKQLTFLYCQWEQRKAQQTLSISFVTQNLLKRVITREKCNNAFSNGVIQREMALQCINPFEKGVVTQKRRYKAFLVSRKNANKSVIQEV